MPADLASEGRPAYEPGDVVNPEIGLSVLRELRNDWRVILSASVIFLAPELTASPIVEKSQVFTGFGAINRLF
ncbi:MAG: MipA/OmpV family protein [bacterium]